MSIQSALLKLGVKLISGAKESDLRSTSVEGILEKMAAKMPESSGGSVTIDNTLTQDGQAADAKAVGDALAGKVANNTAASTAALGLVKQAASVAVAAGDTPTKAEFDGLITALKNAGIMANQ